MSIPTRNHCLRLFRVLGSGLVLNCAFSQPASRLEFDVASIKRSDPSHAGVQTYITAGGFTAKTAPLKNLICFAYRVREHQVVLSANWQESEPFDVSAKSEGQPSNNDYRSMLQALLADRFQLKMHSETREQPIYSLAAGRGGPKLHAVEKAGPGVGIGMRGRLNGVGADMPTLAGALAGVLGRSVVDRTGLTGWYDFELKWTPDETQAETPGPSIFTAIQEQLGLKLESAKGPVEVLVVDHAERPSEN